MFHAWIDKGFLLFIILLVGLVVFVSVTVAAGKWGYEYRCNHEVVEQRLALWDQGIGIFQPIDGDPVGACPTT